MSEYDMGEKGAGHGSIDSAHVEPRVIGVEILPLGTRDELNALREQVAEHEVGAEVLKGHIAALEADLKRAKFAGKSALSRASMLQDRLDGSRAENARLRDALTTIEVEALNTQHPHIAYMAAKARDWLPDSEQPAPDRTQTRGGLDPLSASQCPAPDIGGGRSDEDAWNQAHEPGTG